jgi:hypothetical protein
VHKKKSEHFSQATTLAHRRLGRIEARRWRAVAKEALEMPIPCWYNASVA